MAETASNKQFTTPRSRTFLAGVGCGLAIAILGVTIEPGEIGPWFARLRNGVEAVQNPPTTTQPVTP